MRLGNNDTSNVRDQVRARRECHAVRVLLRNRDLSSVSGHLWVASLRAVSLARGGAMAAYAHADIPSQLLPRLGGLLAEFEKDSKQSLVDFF